MYWYVNYGNGTTTGYYAITRWAATTAKTVGQIVRQLAVPTIYNERCFVCTIAGTTGAAEPAWVLTSGAKTTDGGVTWMECSGRPGVNGSVPYTITWSTTDPALVGTVALGTQINGTTGVPATTLFICTTSGTIGATQPTWNTTLGSNTTDGTVVWTCLGPTSTYTAWQNPIARLGILHHPTATIRTTTNDVIFVGDNHAETGGGSNTITMVSTLAPVHTYCVDHTVATPTGANLKNTAILNANTLILINGNGYLYGLNFTTITAGALCKFQMQQNANAYMTLENCTFTVNGVMSAGNPTSLNLGSANSTNGFVNFINCSISFSDPTSCIAIIAAAVHWKNTSPLLMAGSVVPNFLVSSVSTTAYAYYGTLIFEGVDFTGCTGTLFDNIPEACKISLIKCKLDPTGLIYQPFTTSAVEGNWEIEVANCDSAAGYYRNEKYTGLGYMRSVTNAFRSGGATDGVTPISWLLNTSAFCYWGTPFKTLPISVYNTIVGSPITATIEVESPVTLGNGAGGIWLEASYFGSANSTLRSFASSGTTTDYQLGTNWPTSTATWTIPGGTLVRQQISITITPQAPGLIFFRVVVPRNVAGQTYIDPMVTFS
jgi:hypothetical protein